MEPGQQPVQKPSLRRTCKALDPIRFLGKHPKKGRQVLFAEARNVQQELAERDISRVDLSVCRILDGLFFHRRQPFRSDPAKRCLEGRAVRLLRADDCIDLIQFGTISGRWTFCIFTDKSCGRDAGA